MIKNDKWILNHCNSTDRLIEPFEVQKEKGISWGVSSFGYDLRLADEFKICNGGEYFQPGSARIIDPKNFDPKLFEDYKDDFCIIPPHGFVLGRSVEYLRIPRNIMTVCVGKSTYARCGIILNVTPLEPEWEGYVTLEISNTTPLPAKIYANEGIAQILFFEGEEPWTSYADKKGKYQGQKGITLPRL